MDKKEIITNMCKRFHMELNDEIINYLSNKIDDKEVLESSVTRLAALKTIFDKNELTLEDVKEYLNDFLIKRSN